MFATCSSPLTVAQTLSEPPRPGPRLQPRPSPAHSAHRTLVPLPFQDPGSAPASRKPVEPLPGEILLTLGACLQPPPTAECSWYVRWVRSSTQNGLGLGPLSAGAGIFALHVRWHPYDTFVE